MKYLSHNAPLNKLIIAKLVVTYRKAIVKNLLCILNGRLIYIEPVTIFINHICHIIIPLSLRRVDFNLIHASPITGHMGKYKTQNGYQVLGEAISTLYAHLQVEKTRPG